MRQCFLIPMAGAILAMFSACATNAQTGALGGGLAGTAVGALAGGRHHGAEGALIGAGVGTLGGYMVGNEMDKAQTNQRVDQAIEEANTHVVNVHNSNGSVTPVTLQRSGGYWIGPKGETYDGLPTEDQLQPVYGF